MEIPQKDLITKQEKIAFEYISKYGLGINFQSSIFQVKTPKLEQGQSVFPFLFDVYLNYRPALWLNFKLGISSLSFRIESAENVKVETVYPDITKASNYADYQGKTTSVPGIDMSITSPYIGFDLNWTPTQKFNFGFGVSMMWYSGTTKRKIYHIIKNENGYAEDVGDCYIEQDLRPPWLPLSIFRFELKPQYFLSPRMTLGLYLAYMLAGKFKV